VPVLFLWQVWIKQSDFNSYFNFCIFGFTSVQDKPSCIFI